jgi:predicted nucleotidyltransferase
MSEPSEISNLEKFAIENGRGWEHIFDAKVTTNEIIGKIKATFSLPLFSSDADLVVFGSIARDECNSKSDVDWTILIDGQASSQHYNSSYIVKSRLEDLDLQEPGTTGMFGQVTFSHDLIHYIGGEEDTNHNISRRLLLLLESTSIGFDTSEDNISNAHERVIRGIIDQYITNDSGFRSERGVKLNLPRFLLNDFIRFWRTMCVDFALKQKERRGKNWALRNIKLRLSRKLIFVKGLLMCFSCYQNKSLTSTNEVKEHLKDLALMKPIDVFVSVLSKNNIATDDICKVIDAYNDFLGLMSNSKTREHLSKLHMDVVYKDATFIEAREISDSFQSALDRVFYKKDSKLFEFILKYGLF